MRLRVVAAIVTLLIYPTISSANELKPETISAWDQYVAAVKTRMQQRADGQVPFFWTDEVPGRLQQVRQGQILVARTSGNGPNKVPHGMIHDWTGAIFIPGVSLGQVMRVLDDYDRYKDFYKPQVLQSKLLERTGDNEKTRLLMMQKAFGVTAAFESDNDVRIVKPSPTRAYSFSSSSHVREIADYGKPNEHQLPEDRGYGYVWRTFTVSRLEERDEGVYVEEQTIEMSRNIPIEVRWLIKPLTQHLARTIMLATMKETREAVMQETGVAPEREGPH